MSIEDLQLAVQKEPCMVLLIGPSGSGKSTLARNLAQSEDQIVSSDEMRKVLSGDVSNMEITGKAFHMVHQIITHRCNQGCVTIADATNLKRRDRGGMIQSARKKVENFKIIGVLVEARKETCKERQEKRDRTVPEHVIDRHYQRYKTSVENVKEEDFEEIWKYNSETGEIEKLM